MRLTAKQRRAKRALNNDLLSVGLIVMALIPLTMAAFVYGQIIAGV